MVIPRDIALIVAIYRHHAMAITIIVANNDKTGRNGQTEYQVGDSIGTW